MADQLNYDVFLSHSSQDKDIVRALAERLREDGLRVWFDDWIIKPGDSIPAKIDEGLEQSRMLVLCMSAQAFGSDWTQLESYTFRFRDPLNKERRFVPLRLDAAEIKASLAQFLYINWLPGKQEYAKLLEACRPPASSSDGTVSQRHVPRDLALAYFERLETERLNEKYIALGGQSQLPVHEAEIHPCFELLLVDENGRVLPERRPVPDVIAELCRLRRAVLLGEPGGGKTTTLWKLAAQLGAAYRNHRQDDGQGPLPLLIRLGNWTAADQTLPQFIAQQLGPLGAYLDTLLGQDGERAALLLDGLNELPVSQRPVKYPEVQRFIEAHAHLLAVVSCRELDYTDKFGWACLNIAPLDPQRIRDFAQRRLDPQRGENFFWKLSGEAARATLKEFLGKFADKLPEAERVFWTEPELPAGFYWGYEREGKNDNWRWQRWRKQRETPSSLMMLARNPYLLLMLTSVYAKRQDALPDNRGKLFESFVQNLLDRERKRLDASEQAPLLAGLARVAAAMQHQRQNQADDAEAETQTALPLAEVKAILSERLLELAISASLLSLGEPVRFTHQLLQEYFAAKYLDDERQAGRLTAAELWPPDRWWRRNNWEETAILLAGLHQDDCTPVLDWLTRAQPEIAAQCINRSGALTPEPTRVRLRDQWLKRLDKPELEREPQARAAVGRALGQIAGLDNRPGVAVTRDGLPDLKRIESWIEIPGGKFQYGLANDDWAAKPSQPDLSTFWISRYPVTHAQFRCFLDDAAGYGDSRWWEGLAATEANRQPAEPRFKFDNHPRDTVNWFEAIAFCRWLSWRWGGGYDLRKIDEWRARLPTEFEWEKAARGTDGRLYPYAGKFDATKSNVRETGIGQTSAVGIFPNGKSFYGVEEMSGNVWEWCLSDYGKPQKEARKEKLDTDKARVLRGGAWFLNDNFARAVDRFFNSPGNRINDTGFRLVVARPPSALL